MIIVYIHTHTVQYTLWGSWISTRRTSQSKDLWVGSEAQFLNSEAKRQLHDDAIINIDLVRTVVYGIRFGERWWVMSPMVLFNVDSWMNAQISSKSHEDLTVPKVLLNTRLKSQICIVTDLIEWVEIIQAIWLGMTGYRNASCIHIYHITLSRIE